MCPVDGAAAFFVETLSAVTSKPLYCDSMFRVFSMLFSSLVVGCMFATRVSVLTMICSKLVSQ